MSSVFLRRRFNTLHLAAFEHESRPLFICVVIAMLLRKSAWMNDYLKLIKDLRVTLLDCLFSSLNLTLSENSHETLNGLNA